MFYFENILVFLSVCFYFLSVSLSHLFSVPPVLASGLVSPCWVSVLSELCYVLFSLLFLMGPSYVILSFGFLLFWSIFSLCFFGLGSSLDLICFGLLPIFKSENVFVVSLRCLRLVPVSASGTSLSLTVPVSSPNLSSMVPVDTPGFNSRFPATHPSLRFTVPKLTIMADVSPVSEGSQLKFCCLLCQFLWRATWFHLFQCLGVQSKSLLLLSWLSWLIMHLF